MQNNTWYYSTEWFTGVYPQGRPLWPRSHLNFENDIFFFTKILVKFTIYLAPEILYTNFVNIQRIFEDDIPF